MAARIFQWKDLQRSIRELSFVGPRHLARLKRLGINTIKQLLWHIPSRYEDYSERSPISEIVLGERFSIQGRVERISSRRIFPRRLVVTTAVMSDDTGTIRATWFNQPYIEQFLKPGTIVSLAGKVTLAKTGPTFSSPQFERVDGKNMFGLRHTSGLVPIYPETEGVSSKYLRTLVRPLLALLVLPDYLPNAVRERNGLTRLSSALKTVHYPKTQDEAAAARRRLAFDDLLLFQIKALLARRIINRERSMPIQYDQAHVRTWVAGLPFTLTKDQRVAAWEILKDLARPFPMNRLLEGDVGSGKTAVAILAADNVGRAGYQTVFMAPTEVLAVQHYETAQKLLHDTTIALLTSSRAELNGKPIQKKPLKTRIAKGDISIIIGTHAVIQKDVKFNDLALVIVDEQHRFGISQRAALLHSKLITPHLLSMTATPIPRTLALTVFGDLDISVLREKPENHGTVITRVVSDMERDASYGFIRNQVRIGRQVFVVCPRVETIVQKPDVAMAGTRQIYQWSLKDIWADVKAVENEYKRLSQTIFPDLRVAMLHGRMKPKEKERVMHEFKNKKYDILVSTSVIEVGIDVPNATLMIIENAERFGLAQLHQFRGRVGRGEHQSYCFLFASSDTDRLRALVKCNDGFELAEKDLVIRGPGEFLGVKQSGMPDLAMAALADTELIKKARFEARLILKNDPTLTHFPVLCERLAELEKLTHFE